MFAKWYVFGEWITLLSAGKMYNHVRLDLADSNGGPVAVEKKLRERNTITTGAAAAGILALLVDAREARVKDDKEATKTEVLLDNAGLSLDDIAAVMGKKYDAVRVSIQRNRTR